ncbi:hypothetical protein L7F22_055007 [Adiantum nelumboides]|nr:hypothetical protein [Adiantum nelumboides]
MAMQKKAWMTGELFQAWLEHFKTAIMDDMGLESRHLLILDGHGSHVSLEVVGKAHEAGIDIVTLPPHTSHKLQPLDVSVFKSLKANFQKERAIWQQKTASSQASKSELASIAARALKSSLTEANIESGFQAIGIWPLDGSVVKFESMPCSFINLREETPSHEDADLSQVLCTVLIHDTESEAIHALNLRANQTSMPTNDLGQPCAASDDAKFSETLQQLADTLEEDAHRFALDEERGEFNLHNSPTVSQERETNVKGSSNENDVGEFGSKTKSPPLSTTRIKCQQENLQLAAGGLQVVDLLRVPVADVYVLQASREALVDYTNSLVLTSNQYIESMKAKNAKKEEIAKAREDRKQQKEKKRLSALAEKEAQQKRKVEVVQAKIARKKWEGQ